MTTMVVNQTLVHERCCNCNILFAIPTWLREERLADKASFYCPKGHGQHYVGKTTEQKLRDQLAAEQRKREQAEALAEQRRSRLDAERECTKRVQRRLAATQGVVTKHKRRISAGKCPCCTVKFADLKAHMASQHPDWNTTTEIDALLGKETTS